MKIQNYNRILEFSEIKLHGETKAKIDGYDNNRQIFSLICYMDTVDEIESFAQMDGVLRFLRGGNPLIVEFIYADSADMLTIFQNNNGSPVVTEYNREEFTCEMLLGESRLCFHMNSNVGLSIMDIYNKGIWESLISEDGLYYQGISYQGMTLKYKNITIDNFPKIGKIRYKFIKADDLETFFRDDFIQGISSCCIFNFNKPQNVAIGKLFVLGDKKIYEIIVKNVNIDRTVDIEYEKDGKIYTLYNEKKLNLNVVNKNRKLEYRIVDKSDNVYNVQADAIVDDNIVCSIYYNIEYDKCNACDDDEDLYINGYYGFAWDLNDKMSDFIELKNPSIFILKCEKIIFPNVHEYESIVYYHLEYEMARFSCGQVNMEFNTFNLHGLLETEDNISDSIYLLDIAENGLWSALTRHDACGNCVLNKISIQLSYKDIVIDSFPVINNVLYEFNADTLQMVCSSTYLENVTDERDFFDLTESQKAAINLMNRCEKVKLIKVYIDKKVDIEINKVLIPAKED